MNFPAECIGYATQLVTGPDGWATNEISALDPRNPRGYIDGQLYNIDYRLAVAGASLPPPVEQLEIHVRNAYQASEKPDWKTDLAPFMRQYANLYPIMSRHLFDLADPAVAKQNAVLLTFAFTRDLNDPNHMPVTRDMLNRPGSDGGSVSWIRSR